MSDANNTLEADLNDLETACAKCELASGLGVRLLYCQRCEVVELEIGAFTLRLSPQSVQRIANVMMKASLKLDGVMARQQQKNKTQVLTPAPQLIH